MYFWKTRKVRSLFVLKDTVSNKANVIYMGTRSCSEIYEVRWREHYSTNKTSEAGGHLLLNTGHTVNWEILTNAPKRLNKRKIWEAFYI